MVKGGMCGGGCVWKRRGMHGEGGMHGRAHVWQGHAWQRDMHGRGHVWQGACMAGGGGVHGRGACMMGACIAGGGGMHGRGCAWQVGCAWQDCAAWQILRDVVNERAVRILLECILVAIKILVVYRVTLVVTLAFFAPNFLGRKR